MQTIQPQQSIMPHTKTKSPSPCPCHKKKHKGKKEKAPKKRRTHGPSAYNLFVRKHYDSVRDIPSPQDRMCELGRRWKAHEKRVATQD